MTNDDFILEAAIAALHAMTGRFPGAEDADIARKCFDQAEAMEKEARNREIGFTRPPLENYTD